MTLLRFQFLGIPPKGEREIEVALPQSLEFQFPISRDPPEGGTCQPYLSPDPAGGRFPISRDPPEGGTANIMFIRTEITSFQFLGIPPKGEQQQSTLLSLNQLLVSNF